MLGGINPKVLESFPAIFFSGRPILVSFR